MCKDTSQYSSKTQIASGRLVFRGQNVMHAVSSINSFPHSAGSIMAAGLQPECYYHTVVVFLLYDCQPSAAGCAFAKPLLKPRN